MLFGLRRMQIRHYDRESLIISRIAVNFFLATKRTRKLVFRAALADRIEADLGNNIEQTYGGRYGRGSEDGRGNPDSNEETKAHLDGVFARESTPLLPLFVKLPVRKTQIAAGVAKVLLPKSLKTLLRDLGKVLLLYERTRAARTEKDGSSTPRKGGELLVDLAGEGIELGVGEGVEFHRAARAYGMA